MDYEDVLSNFRKLDNYSKGSFFSELTSRELFLMYCSIGIRIEEVKTKLNLKILKESDKNDK